MDSACDFLLKTLEDESEAGEALAKLYTADKSRENSFSLSEVLSFLPDRRHEQLCKHLTRIIKAAYENFTSSSPSVNHEHELTIERTSHITWLLLQQRKTKPTKQICKLILQYHSIILKIPMGKSQNTIAHMCEWLWQVDDGEKKSAISYTLLYLLLRSFGDETFFIHTRDQQSNEKVEKQKFGGKLADLKRVYQMRKAFLDIDLVQHHAGTSTIRNLLLRCTTSKLYLSESEGRKFISFLLSIEDIRDEMFDALINQLTVVKKTKAPLFGNIFLQSWVTNRSDWLSDRLIKVAEQSILTIHDPFSSNLKTVMSSFHLNKRMNGIDLLLHKIYAPTLFGNLFVANPIVRRNASIILTEAFPIHDPGATREEIDKMLQQQSDILLQLLTDQSPIVRVVTIQGVCKLLGLMYEIMPNITCKRMIDLLINKLSMDSSSSNVRLAVFNGLKFMMSNHLLYSILSIQLKVLKPLIYDRCEKVRLAFLDLLSCIKEKRLKTLRYFDVVPMSDLINLMAIEHKPIAMKIMSLIISSYFPITKKGYNQQQISNMQVKACFSMMESNFNAARFFYQQLNLFVMPAPVCEFAFQISNFAFNEAKTKSKRNNKSKQHKKAPTRTLRSRITIEEENDEEDDGEDENSSPNGMNRGQVETEDKLFGTEADEEQKIVNQETLLIIISDLFQSIRPSLVRNEKNKVLREHIDGLFDGSALKPLLVERGNSIRSRVASWRIASCVTVSKVTPLVVLWREQMDSVIEWQRSSEKDVESFKELLTALVVCGLRWKRIPTLLAIVAGCGDGATNGRRTAHIGSKLTKRDKSSKRTATIGRGKAKGRGKIGVGREKGAEARNEDDSNDQDASELEKDSQQLSILEGREGNIYALQALGTILMDEEVKLELLQVMMAMEKENDEGNNTSIETPPARLLSCIRKGILGAFDHVLETLPDMRPQQIASFQVNGLPLLLCTLATSLKASVTYALNRELCGEGELIDVREILQWLCSSQHVWLHLNQLPVAFSSGLAAVCMGPFADIAALKKFSEQDLKLLSTVCDRICKRLSDVKDISSIDRIVMEMTRLGLLLDEQANDFEFWHTLKQKKNDEEQDPEENEMDKPGGPTKERLREASLEIIQNVFKMLQSVRDDERQAGEVFEQDNFQQFLIRALTHMSRHNDTDTDDDESGVRFVHTISSIVQSQFANDNNAESNFLTATICNGIRLLACTHTKRVSGPVDEARRIFDFVWRCLSDSNENKEGIVTFVTLICKSFIKHYDKIKEDEGEEENQGKKNERNKPTVDIVNLFCHIEHETKKQVKIEDNLDLSEEIAEVLHMLSILKHMREEDVSEKNDDLEANVGDENDSKAKDNDAEDEDECSGGNDIKRTPKILFKGDHE